jgi:hypothetical protein
MAAINEKKADSIKLQVLPQRVFALCSLCVRGALREKLIACLRGKAAAADLVAVTVGKVSILFGSNAHEKGLS